MDPVQMYERAATRAAEVARSVTEAQRALPTPCSEWNVDDLLEHMAGGTAYLAGGRTDRGLPGGAPCAGRSGEAVPVAGAVRVERG